MKKLSFIFSLMAVFALSVFTSCTKEEDPKPGPSINFLGMVNNSTIEVAEGDSAKVEWVANKGGANLKSFDVLLGTSARYMGFNNGQQKTLSGSERDKYQASLQVKEAGIYTFRVTDADDQSAEVKVTVKRPVAKPTETALSAEQNFEWKRGPQLDPATVLATYGLTWTSNSGTSAIIKKGADKLVILSAADYTSITTKEALKAKVDGSAGVEQYTGVSVTQTKDYNDVIATKKGDVYYLINVKKGTVTTATAGTTVTITGKYKN